MKFEAQQHNDFNMTCFILEEICCEGVVIPRNWGQIPAQSFVKGNIIHFSIIVPAFGNYDFNHRLLFILIFQMAC
jgi:hypothetical protein